MKTNNFEINKQEEKKLELNNIYCGDCLDLMAKIKDTSIDLIATDPPYVINVSSNGTRTEYGDYSFPRHFFKFFIKECKRILKVGHHLYMFCDWRTYPLIWEASLGTMTLKNLVVWDIGRPRLGNYYRFSYEMICFFINDITAFKFTGQKINRIKIIDRAKRDIWHISDIPMVNRSHPSQKPLAVIEEIILNSSKKDDLVLDSFAGSGTTLMAAKKHNRNFLGFEINPNYVEIAKNRLKENQEENAND
ncbi:site-specific DNA-methyltransferase [Candidatus Poribacteria bacterium]|nr:site-specific DNA-methyltransferase [Candidatus Poribacteria bacterium]